MVDRDSLSGCPASCNGAGSVSTFRIANVKYPVVIQCQTIDKPIAVVGRFKQNPDNCYCYASVAHTFIKLVMALGEEHLTTVVEKTVTWCC